MPSSLVTLLGNAHSTAISGVIPLEDHRGAPYVGGMEDKREEIYERIPWDTIASPKADRQPLIIGVAAAIVVGALVYSYMSNRPVEAPVPVAVTETAPAAASTIPLAPMAPAPLPTAPQVIAEADLYAVAPDRLASSAASYAEWFVMEYLTSSGASESSIIRQMLAPDIPVPTLPEETVVFVEWVSALSIADLDVGRHSVDVLVRYLVSRGGGPYERVDPEIFRVEVVASGSDFQIVGAPEIVAFTVGDPSGPMLGEVPADVVAGVAAARPDASVVGGTALPDGTWRVVVMASGPGGIERPETVVVAPATTDPPVSP